MKHIQVLDCTLRDGGYCNKWNFGNSNIKKIMQGLIEANIDIVECGILTNKVVYDPDVTKFSSIRELAGVIPVNRNNKIFVVLMNYGEYNPDNLPNCDGSSIDGLRVAFHKKDRIEAIEECRKIKAKGYKVFIQPMVSLSYTDEEFLDLIHQINEMNPYAFYIVDSFGMMKHKSLTRLFYLVEHNLRGDVKIGFHSHNNMQLAYSNAQRLVDIHTDRQLIIDSSIYGMGRGAGNLNTELFVEYINENAEGKYYLKPLLTIIDEILSGFYQQNYWGYSLPNYLSAKHNVHPNYASYLDEKRTLTVENMDEIFSMMDDSKRFIYDKFYIEDLYTKYMASGQVQEEHYVDLQKRIIGKNVLIIAPGKSSVDEREKVISIAKQDDIVTISINFDYPEYDTDYIFLSNLRRYRELDILKRSKCIVTSNIPAVDVYLKTQYGELLNNQESIRDNAGMMLIKFLIKLKAAKILIAGMDGYSYTSNSNYAKEKMEVHIQKEMLKLKNEGMHNMLIEYIREIPIKFVTETILM